MSVNNVLFDEKHSTRPILWNSFEEFHLETDDISEFTWICGNGYPGSSIGFGSPAGKLFVSDLRLIFVSETKFPRFQSFSCPFHKILKLSFERPSIFSFSKTILTASISPQVEADEGIEKELMGTLRIRFNSLQTAKSVERLLKSKLDLSNTKSPNSISDSFASLPSYSPALPSYTEATGRTAN